MTISALTASQMTSVFAQAFTEILCENAYATHLPRIIDIPPMFNMSPNHRAYMQEVTGFSGCGEQSLITHGRVSFDVQWHMLQSIVHMAAAHADHSSTTEQVLLSEIESFKRALLGVDDAILGVAEKSLASAAMFAALIKSPADKTQAARLFAKSARAFEDEEGFHSSAAMLWEVIADISSCSTLPLFATLNTRHRAAKNWLSSFLKEEHVHWVSSDLALSRGKKNGVIGDIDLESVDVDMLLLESAIRLIDKNQSNEAMQDFLLLAYRTMRRGDELTHDEWNELSSAMRIISSTRSDDAFKDLADLAEMIAKR
ncbi:MAG: hypothetical protein ABH871_07905 [Pseudomonadota bacterium]